MLQSIIGPIAGLAGSWLDAKTQAQTANAKLKLTEAEAKAKIMLSKETSVADWERIMAQGSQSSWKDEWFVIVLSIPLVLAFVPGLTPFFHFLQFLRILFKIKDITISAFVT